jgi:hypothetical protein
MTTDHFPLLHYGIHRRFDQKTELVCLLHELYLLGRVAIELLDGSRERLRCLDQLGILTLCNHIAVTPLAARLYRRMCCL